MEFEPCDRAVYVPAADALVCSDLHVGREEASNVELRLGEREDVVGRFEALLDRYGPAEAIVAGDLLHSFDALSPAITETVGELRHTASRFDCRMVVTPGNHDTALEKLWDGAFPDHYRLDGTDVLVTHGHRRPMVDADRYVVGHDHPVVEMEGVRRPCYLYGPEQYEGADVLMLPSFSRVPAGVAVNEMSARDFQSPLVVRADELRPIVRDEAADQTYEFPPLGELRRLL